MLETTNSIQRESEDVIFHHKKFTFFCQKILISGTLMNIKEHQWTAVEIEMLLFQIKAINDKDKALFMTKNNKYWVITVSPWLWGEI